MIIPFYRKSVLFLFDYYYYYYCYYYYYYYSLTLHTVVTTRSFSLKNIDSRCGSVIYQVDEFQRLKFSLNMSRSYLCTRSIFGKIYGHKTLYRIKTLTFYAICKIEDLYKICSFYKFGKSGPKNCKFTNPEKDP